MDYQVNDVLQAMQADAECKIHELKVDGGASKNDLLLQMQSDILNIPVIRPKCVETTAMGAAYLAGLAVGFFKNKEQIASLWEADHIFTPVITEEQRAKKIAGWQKAVSYSYSWAREN
jgi:glycerol kinase